MGAGALTPACIDHSSQKHISVRSTDVTSQSTRLIVVARGAFKSQESQSPFRPVHRVHCLIRAFGHRVLLQAKGLGLRTGFHCRLTLVRESVGEGLKIIQHLWSKKDLVNSNIPSIDG